MSENVALDIAKETVATNVTLIAKKASRMTGGGETQTEKWVVKLTAKMLGGKLESLQNERKSKLNKASVVRKTMQSLMLNDDKMEEQNAQ